jgi:hypothetical protein
MPIAPVFGPPISVPLDDVASRAPPAEVRSFPDVLERGPRAPPKAIDLVRPERPVRALVEGALDAERELDAVVAAARAGRTFSAAELLALQTKVFRYTQAVEVISRATDRVVGALKQALATQV